MPRDGAGDLVELAEGDGGVGADGVAGGGAPQRRGVAGHGDATPAATAAAAVK